MGCLLVDRAHARDVGAVRVGLRHEDAVALRAHARRLHRDDAARIARPVVRPEIEDLQRIVVREIAQRRPHDTAIVGCRDRGDADLVGRHQRAVGDARHDAVGRLASVAHPAGQLAQQRAQCPGVRIGVGLLHAHAEGRHGRQRQVGRPVLSRGEDEGAHVARVGHVAPAERIGEAQRLARLPDLQRSRDVEDPWAGAVGVAAIEDALPAAGDRIGLRRVVEREIVGLIEVIDLVAPGASRMAEAHVERHQAAADMRQRTFEHLAAALVGVEAQMQVRADEAPALRGAHDDRRVARAVDRIARARRIGPLEAEERADIAQRREADPQHDRILGTVDKLVEPARLEACRQADLGIARRLGLAVGAGAEAPLVVWDRHARRIFLRAHGQARPESVGQRELVVRRHGRISGVREPREPAGRQRQRLGRCRDDDLGTQDARDARPVGIARDGRAEPHAVGAVREVRLPAEPDERVALLHQEAVAGTLDRVPVQHVGRHVGVEVAHR